MSSTDTTPATFEPLRVNGAEAARIMGCGRSTFFMRVKAGLFPKAGKDGQWSVRQLRECCEKLDEKEPAPT